MATPTGALVSVEEYLTTVYRPDCDFVDGVLEDRNVGEHDHSRLELLIGAYFLARERTWGCYALVEQRVQISRSKYRVPDVCVLLARSREPVVTSPPFLCIEILSPEDRMSRMQRKIDDYLRFGVPFVWVIDPDSGSGWVYTSSGAIEAKDGVLRTRDPEFALPLAEVIGA